MGSSTAPVDVVEQDQEDRGIPQLQLPFTQQGNGRIEIALVDHHEVLVTVFSRLHAVSTGAADGPDS